MINGKICIIQHAHPVSCKTLYLKPYQEIPMDNNITKQVKEILSTTQTIAVVGLSPKENRPSNMVARYLKEHNFTIIPVNPAQQEILGETCYPTLSAIPKSVDLVNIFRRSDDIPPVVKEAIAIGAKAVWMQEGIVNEEAAQEAHAAGLKVIMDRCLKVDHAVLAQGNILTLRL